MIVRGIVDRAVAVRAAACRKAINILRVAILDSAACGCLFSVWVQWRKSYIW